MIERVVCLLVVMLLPQCVLSQEKQKTCKSTVTGTVQIFELASKVFGNTRSVRVFLPPSYDKPENSSRKYPVLYMLDGQNLFDACTSYAGEWEVDETVTRLVDGGVIEPVIVVGIDNAREKRAFEYLPWQDNIQNPAGGEVAGERMPEFLINEVMPVISKKYRVAEGRDNTAIGGSSYGGIAALYVGVTAARVFGKVLAESPVLWPGNAELLRQTSPLPVAPLAVFMAYGGKEIGDPEARDAAIKLVRTMEANLKSALVSPAMVKVIIEPDAQHNERAWAKRFPDAITFLFPLKKK